MAKRMEHAMKALDNSIFIISATDKYLYHIAGRRTSKVNLGSTALDWNPPAVGLTILNRYLTDTPSSGCILHTTSENHEHRS